MVDPSRFIPRTKWSSGTEQVFSATESGATAGGCRSSGDADLREGQVVKSNRENPRIRQEGRSRIDAMSIKVTHLDPCRSMQWLVGCAGRRRRPVVHAAEGLYRSGQTAAGA